MEITVYPRARASFGRAVALPDWPAFVSWLTDRLAVEESDKRDLPAVGPFMIASGAPRGNDAVQAVTVGALDVDGIADAALGALVDRLAAFGLDAVVHTSPSDPGGDLTVYSGGPLRKVRVYVALSRPLAPAECRPFRRALAALLEVDADPRALEPARIFFAGRITGTPPRALYETRGVPLDVDALGLVPETDAPQAALDAPAGGAPDDLVARMAAALEDAWAEDGHQTWVLPFFGWLASNGWDEADRVALVDALGAPDAERASKYLSMARRAEPMTGLSEDAVAALGDALPAVEGLARAHPAALWAPYFDMPPEAPVRIERALEAARAEAAALTVAQADADAAAQGSAPVEQPFPALCKIEDWTAPIPPRAYTYESLRLDHGKISLIGGYAGTGKGPLANLLAVHRALGRPVFGGAVRQGHVLFLDAETGEEAKRRLQRICAGLDADPTAVQEYLHFGTLVPSADPQVWMYDLRRAADAWPDLTVMLDSYTSAMFASALESSDPRYATLAHELGMFSRDAKALVVALAHTRKVEGPHTALTDIAGTNALAAMTQTAILLRRPDPTDEYRVEVSCARAPAGRFDAFEVRWEGDDGGPLKCRVIPPEERPAPPATKTDLRDAAKADAERTRRSQIIQALETAGVSLNVTSLRARVTGRPDAIKDSVLALVHEGVLQDQGGGAYVLAPQRSATAVAFAKGRMT